MSDQLTGKDNPDVFTTSDGTAMTESATPLESAGGHAPLPPRVFRHEDLAAALTSAQVLEKKRLINMVNYLHFMGGHVHVLFHHPAYGEEILFQALPEPCYEDRLTCRWDVGTPFPNPERYQFRYLVMSTDQSIVFVPATLLEIAREGIVVRLPEESRLLSLRQSARFPCTGTAAELLQNGFHAKGELVDFGTRAFRIRIRPETATSFMWFNADLPATIHLTRGREVLFAHPCRCVRQELGDTAWELVLEPHAGPIARYQPRKFRSTRREITPMPAVEFVHPFVGRKIRREIVNISHSGFSVREMSGRSVLLPGMIIPEVTITYAGILKMTATAQVIHRQEVDGYAVCGLAILDMELDQYTSLSHILGYVNNAHTFVAGKVDMDALWEFLFDTGFIYPKKYRLFQEYRHEFKETYRKLYEGCSEIAQHFTYEQEGRIYAHAAMLRAYDKSWLGHHLAARPLEGKRTGFVMVKHVADHLGGLSRLPSANMGYLMFYFRPDNTFMYTIFGETTRSYGKPSHCSVDLFAYVPYEKRGEPDTLPEGWSMRRSSVTDLWEMTLAYNHGSGGLLLDAIDVKENSMDALKRSYAQRGFHRDMECHSLLCGDDLRACLIVDRSDLGVNLAELLNSVKVIAIDPENLPWEVLSTACDVLAETYAIPEVPILIHPEDYARRWQVPVEKHYMLWILAMRHSKGYVEFLHERFGITIRD